MNMNSSARELFAETMLRLDQGYSEEAGMLTRTFRGRSMHDLRGSCHYALGLLIRNLPGDREKAETILHHVLGAQFTGNPDAAFYGSFPFDDRLPSPPDEPFPGTHFDAFSRYYLEKWQEQIRGRFLNHLAEAGYRQDQISEIEGLAKQSLLETVPVVWGNFDANWREFVVTELALMLALAEDKLDPALVQKMEEAAKRGIEGSIRRWNNHIIPMNTNVELMHVFICGFFGEWLKNAEYLAHARDAASDLATRYHEFESFAEYNSTTYNSVDLIALAMWRLYLKDPDLVRIGTELEAGLWRNIADMYHPLLNQVCGPNARNYDDDMQKHSMVPALLYVAFDGKKPVPEWNMETAGFIEVALNGTQIPEDVQKQFLEWKGPHGYTKRFRELMERGCPDDDTSVCEVTASFDETWMMGAMKGSRNTSGQLHSFTAFWKAPDETVSDMVLLRRVPGGNEGEHLWTVFFNGEVQDNQLSMTVRPEVDRDLEVFFRVKVSRPEQVRITDTEWQFPGAVFQVETNAGSARVVTNEDQIEIIYAVPKQEPAVPLIFHLTLNPQ